MRNIQDLKLYADSRRTLHCVRSVQIRNFSGPHFPVFSRKTGKYRSEKAPHLDTFHAVLRCDP